jgi:hypothetical protein
MLTTIIGTVGLSLILIAFILNSFKLLSTDTQLYNLLNVVGGGLLIYYAAKLGSIPFLILESVWTIFSIYKVIVLFNAFLNKYNVSLPRPQ